MTRSYDIEETPIVWIEGGVAQWATDGVLVIDTDPSSFPDAKDLRHLYETREDAKAAFAPEWIMDAIDAAITNTKFDIDHGHTGRS